MIKTVYVLYCSMTVAIFSKKLFKGWKMYKLIDKSKDDYATILDESLGK